jgi:hypothetical protein
MMPLLTALNISSDLFVIFYGLEMIRSLQVKSKWQRVGVTVLALLGVFVMTASLIRLLIQYRTNIKVSKGDHVRTGKKMQETEIWAGVEMVVAVVAGCLPGMRRTFIKSRLWNKVSIANSGISNGSGSRRSDLRRYKLDSLEEGRPIRSPSQSDL